MTQTLLQYTEQLRDRLGDGTVVVVLAALLGAVLLKIALKRGAKRRAPGRRWFGQAGRATPQPDRPVPGAASHHAIQLDDIARVAFETAPLLNREESPFLAVLDRSVARAGQGHRVMAQCSLGELIRPKLPRGASTTERQNARRAYLAINSKRLDFAILDRHGHLAVALEYQGTGHHRNAAFLRDAVKREAVRRAGAAFVEIAPGTAHDRLSEDIAALLGPPPAGYTTACATASPFRRSHAASPR